MGPINGKRSEKVLEPLIYTVICLLENEGIKVIF